MSDTEYQDILYRIEDRAAFITLSRPKTHNALTVQMRDELTRALKRAESDDRVSVVVIEGAGPSFCSGYDISSAGYGSVNETKISPLLDGWTDQVARSILRDWFTIWDLLKPVIAKVHGNCLAGGTELMSMCDIVFVTDDARIGYPAMRGQSTPDLAYQAWKMSMARAKYLQLSGNIISGKQAAEWGWVTKSFPSEEFDSAVSREIKAIASIAPDMLAANKLCLNQTYEIMGFRTALYAATPWHHLSAKVRPNAGEFRRIAESEGLKAALKWRDGPFAEVDVPGKRKG